jgi:hypothetical protein
MPLFAPWSRACREAVAREPLMVAFMGLALATRLTFWLYAGRIWEDAVISLPPARNVWEGVGLTHHIAEPRVHTFTSALGELVLIFGEAFGPGYGITAMRIASLLAALAAIYYATCLCRRLGVHWWGQVLLLGYLATDQLHVFFGMAGMETQIAVALSLANAWYFLDRRWSRLGFASGLAVICRPEFLLWPAVVCAALAIEWWRGRREAIGAFVAFAIPAALASLPWIVFATLYYGSPVPHTIRVKSFIARIIAENVSVGRYLADAWGQIAPFRQFTGFDQVPVSDLALQVVVAAVLALAVLGAVSAVRRDSRMLAILAVVAGFFAYRALARVMPYFMWYTPPFTALLFLFAACGVSWIAQRQKAVAALAACALAAAYAIPLGFSMPLDKRVQEEVENKVRLPVGQKLRELMGDRDTVVLEPLGFIGWGARNKTTYDWPGLSSPTAFAAYQRDISLSGFIANLSPTFLALRPREWDELATRKPEVAARYEAVETFRARADLSLRFGGAAYSLGDTVFTIYRLRQR